MPVFENREQFLSRMQEALGERTDDIALNFIQDALDTYDSSTDNSGGISQDEHNRLMKEQDDTWRKRYRDTFFGKPDPSFNPEGMKDKSKSDPAGGTPGSSENNPVKYDDLFSAK